MRYLATLILCFFTGGAFATPLPSDAHVYVEGSAEVTVAPDRMTVTVTLEKIDPVLDTAKNDVDQRTFTLLAALRGIGIDDDDISSRQLHIGPAYEYRQEGRERVGTRVYREVQIELQDLEAYAPLISAFTEANVSSIARASFHVADNEAVLDRVSDMALADARRRAERYARAAGRGLGRVHSISEFNLRSEESWQLHPLRGIVEETEETRARVGGAPPEEPFVPGSLTAVARVYVVYLLGR